MWVKMYHKQTRFVTSTKPFQLEDLESLEVYYRVCYDCLLDISDVLFRTPQQCGEQIATFLSADVNNRTVCRLNPAYYGKSRSKVTASPPGSSKLVSFTILIVYIFTD